MCLMLCQCKLNLHTKLSNIKMYFIQHFSNKVKFCLNIAQIQILKVCTIYLFLTILSTHFKESILPVNACIFIQC